MTTCARGSIYAIYAGGILMSYVITNNFGHRLGCKESA
jgi:hypothetical protein